MRNTKTKLFCFFAPLVAATAALPEQFTPGNPNKIGHHLLRNGEENSIKMNMHNYNSGLVFKQKAEGEHFRECGEGNEREN